MNMCCRSLLVSIAGFLLLGCSLSDDAPKISVYAASFDFNVSAEGWMADFADFPAVEGDSIPYEFSFSHTNLPPYLGAQKGLMLSCSNYSDDLFMFMKKKITGLIPNTVYSIVFEIELATNARTNSTEPSAPASGSVFLKAGASAVEPASKVESNEYVLNIDKGAPNQNGAHAIFLGDVATPPSYNGNEYVIMTRSNDLTSGPEFIARSNDAGEIWIFVGTDSLFEDPMTVYFTKVSLVFSAPY